MIVCTAEYPNVYLILLVLLYNQYDRIHSNLTSSQVVCKALYAFAASREDELSFPKDAMITNIEKQDGEWWQGDYGQQVQYHTMT